MDLANPKCFWLAANFRLSDFSSYKILNLLQVQEDKTWERRIRQLSWGSNSISTLGIASRKIGHENGLVIEAAKRRLSPS